MRRTITTLMFLAVGGLAFAARAADSGNWNYYSAGQSHYKISDDDDATGAAESSPVANAVGKSEAAGQEKKALYVAEKAKSAGELLQTNYFAAGAGGGCQDNCGCNNNCNGCNGCNSCLSDCCCDCTTDGFRIEWLGWFGRGRNTPPLVTSSPLGTPVSNPLPVAGAIGPGLPTTVVYGADPIGTNLRNGGRLTYSHLFNDGITSGTFRFWGIEDGSETFAVNQGQQAIIGLPFTDTFLGVPNAYLAAHPDVTATGDVRVTSKNDIVGADAFLSRCWYSDGCSSIDILGGYQFARLDDSVAIATNSLTVAAPVNGQPANTTFSTFDSFRTQNEFHGGSLGVLARSYRGAVTLEGMFKLAAGSQRERVAISGNNSVNGTVTDGGVYAQFTNIGTREQNHFVFIPEINTNLVYSVNQNWHLIGGYSFIYWSRAVLAGNQIDPNVNSTQFFGGNLVGSPTPAPKFQRSDFWVQGISLGTEYRW